MQSANTKAQMETARRSVEQITNIKAIARHLRKGAPRVISDAQRRLEVDNQAYSEVRTFLKEHEERAGNAMRARTRAHVNKRILEVIPEWAWTPESPSKGPQSYIEALAEARNAYAEAEKVCADAFRELGKAKEKANYYEIVSRKHRAENTVQSEKASLEQVKQLWREALSSLKKTDPPTLKGRCIETICGALSPTCTEKDLESLSIPTILGSDITIFCDCLYLIQGENISV